MLVVDVSKDMMEIVFNQLLHWDQQMHQFAKLTLHVLMHSMQHMLHAKLQVLNVQLMELLDVFL